MGDIIEFIARSDEFNTQELLEFKDLCEIQLKASRDFSEPILQSLAWVNKQLEYNMAGQMNLPFEENLLDLTDESYFNK